MGARRNDKVIRNKAQARERYTDAVQERRAAKRARRAVSKNPYATTKENQA